MMLSHIHRDHVGGLPTFLEKNSDVTVYQPVSFPESIKEDTRRLGAKVIEVQEPLQICKNAYSTGELGGAIKEQSLAIKTSKGLVVITGCAHPGIVNILQEAKQEFKDDVYLAVGGFHLVRMNIKQLTGIINDFKEEGIQKTAPSHCSGDLAREQFKKAYKEDYIQSGAGKKIKMDGAFRIIEGK